MLGAWQSHSEYRELVNKFKDTFRDNPILVDEWASLKSYWKPLRRFDLDPALDVMKDMYSETGRPSTQQPQILRSFALMSMMHVTSVTAWVNQLKNRPLLALLIGCDPHGVAGTVIKVPSIGAHYDLQWRLWVSGSFEETHTKRDLEALLSPRFFNRIHETVAKIDAQKKKNTLKKGEKLPEATPTITECLTKWDEDDKEFPLHYEKNLQDLFRKLALIPSVNAGVIPSENLTVSGDGTAFHVHSNPKGHRPHEAEYKAQPYEECPRYYQDPEASFGWDSDLGVSYFGYTLYNLCVHNSDLKVDLPVHIRVTSAARHDSVSGIIALHEFFELDPDISVKNVCLDSAHDNMATHKWLLEMGIRPFIDLNDNRGRKPKVPSVPAPDENGVPKCYAGLEMVRCGNDYKRMRTKYRCPLKCGKISQCPLEASCSDSDYGRTKYVNMKDNPRLNPPVARDSKEYKEVYSNRTSCERCNNRFLNDYKLAQWKGHTRMRTSFMAIMDAICMHLQAQEAADPSKD